MPDIIVNFVPDFSKVETATDQLVSSGQISKPFVEELKKVQGSVDQTAAATTSSLGKLSANTKGIARQMAEGMKDGLKDGLKDAADKLDKDLKRIKDSFKQVSGSKELTALNAQLKVFKTALASEKRPAVIDAYTKAIGELTLEVQTLEDAENNSAGASKSLKQELRELTAAIAQANLEGKNSGPAFQAMVDRAGEIKDAMGDAAATVNTFASDTAKLDAAIEVVTGAAAAFSVLQGATALLGDESKELQEVMVKLQATQAVLNGLQQIYNLTQKDRAAINAVIRIQTLAGVAATNLETAAQSRNIVVKGAATVAMRLLNTVMKANPVFLLVAAFAALGGALAFFANRTKDAVTNTELLNQRLEEQNRVLEGNLQAIDDAGRIRIARLKQQGADEARIHGETILIYAREARALGASVSQRVKDLQTLEKQQFKGIESFAQAEQQLNDINRSIAEGGEGLNKKEKAFLEGRKIILEGIVNDYEQLGRVQVAIAETNANFSAERAEEARRAAKEAQDKRDKDAKEAAARERERQRQRLLDIKANIERELLTVEDGSKKQLELRVKLADAEKNISAFDAKSTAEKKLIYAQYLKAIGDLTTDFYKEQKTKAIQSQIDTLTALLANDKIAAQEREALTVDLLEKQRQLELSQVINNQEKIKEINARFDKEIAEQRLAIRQQAFEQEQALETAQGATRKRHIESLADDENANVIARILAIRQVEQIDTASVEKRMASNEQLFRDGLITETAYKTELARLKDEEAQIHENAEKKRTGVTNGETEKRKAKALEEVQAVLGAAEQIIGSINSIAQAFSERTLANIEGQKKALDQLKEAGAITEKEFTKRQKRLEAEEIAAKLRAAKRDKAVALFSAVVEGARAIVSSAKDGPIMIALTAALVAAQIAVIAAKPLPKFGKGTKRAPKGFAEIGETGAELVQDEKGYYLAQHPQIVYLKGGEKIYNPKETIQILQQETPMAKADLTSSKGSNNSPAIDYKKLTKMFGDEIARHPRNVINMDEQGFTRHVIEAQSKTRYLNKRHTFNG